MAILSSLDCGIDQYHAAPFLSASKLQDFARKGPRYFHDRHIARTTAKSTPSDAFVFGLAFEDLVYGLPLSERFAVKPANMSFATTAGKSWKLDAEASGRPIISSDDYAAMVAMRESVRSNSTAMSMIEVCSSQTTYRCEYPGTPGLQARPDWDSRDGCVASGFEPFTLDLKSTIGLAKLANGRGVLEYGYHAQAAIASHCVLRNIHVTPRSYLLTVEKVAPYRALVIEMGQDWVAAGWRWATRRLERLASHYATGEWPCVEREMVQLPSIPAWADVDSIDESESGK